MKKSKKTAPGVLNLAAEGIEIKDLNDAEKREVKILKKIDKVVWRSFD